MRLWREIGLGKEFLLVTRHAGTEKFESWRPGFTVPDPLHYRACCVPRSG
ncbi:hypothetical protein HNQ08_003195 [Deinococcus humi]|uniref:Uncharacterized protein n=1 Tax=Deinococcus humi TaxID=662880 RepID=A0A7W8JWF5_9DEIO|nr:hypothetical protein [Deinococcus humi]